MAKKNTSIFNVSFILILFFCVPTMGAAPENIELKVRSQELLKDERGFNYWRTVEENKEIPASQVAIIICDVWCYVQNGNPQNPYCQGPAGSIGRRALRWAVRQNPLCQIQQRKSPTWTGAGPGCSLCSGDPRWPRCHRSRSRCIAGFRNRLRG